MWLRRWLRRPNSEAHTRLHCGHLGPVAVGLHRWYLRDLDLDNSRQEPEAIHSDGSVDLQLLDLTPDRVCSNHWHRHFSMYLCRLRAFSKSEIGMLDLFRIRRMRSM